MPTDRPNRLTGTMREILAALKAAAAAPVSPLAQQVYAAGETVLLLPPLK